MAIMLFPTDTMPNGKEFLRYNPGVEFASSEWLASVPLGLGAILLYICTYISITAIGVCNAPRYAIEKEGFMDMFGFIIYVYAPEAYWWGLVLYTGNFTYTLIQVFGNPIVQIYASLFVVLAMVLLELRVYPSVFPQMNRINVAIKTAYMFFAILSVCFVDTQAPEVKADTDRVPQVIIGIGLGVGVIFLMLLANSLFFGVGRRKWRAVHNQRMARRARAVMTLVTIMPERKFIPALKNMCDADWERMRESNMMLTAAFLKMQSGRHWWQQRIIPNAQHAVYDQREVSIRAHELICQRVVFEAMEANTDLHKQLDRLQDLIQDMSTQQLDPEKHLVTTAVAAALKADELRSALPDRLQESRQASAGGVRSMTFFRNCLRLPAPPSSGTWSSRGEPEAISLQELEEVPVSLQSFVTEFGGRRGLTDAELQNLHQALDHERSGEVPLARIVAMVLSHAHRLDDEGPGNGAEEPEEVSVVDTANWRSLVPRMPGNEEDLPSDELRVQPPRGFARLQNLPSQRSL